MYVASTEWTILQNNILSFIPTYEVIPALLLDLVRILKRLSPESQLLMIPTCAATDAQISILGVNVYKVIDTSPVRPSTVRIVFTLMNKMNERSKDTQIVTNFYILFQAH